jgi:hypothetical protein
LSSIYYGPGSSYDNSQNVSEYSYEHSFDLTGLDEDTGYSYRANIVSVNGTEATRFGYFTTAHKYSEPITVTNASLNDTLMVNVSEVKTVIEMSLNNTIENGSLNITYSTDSPVNMTMGVAELGRFVKIEASPDVRDSLKSIMLKVYYTDEELEDANINESSLAMYWYNETTASWIKLSTDLSWVYGAGVNMQENYVWANVSHFSDYTVGGDNVCALNGDHPTCGEITLQEVVSYILRWTVGRAQLQDVISLIDGWRETV